MTQRIDTPASTHHLTILDGWRGFAIAALLIGHFAPVPGINMGRFGVELFFALSGRLMAEILFVRRFPLPAFFRRRISRVWPALFAFVLAMALVAPALALGPVPLVDVIAALGFVSNYVSSFGHRVFVLDHLWSLCIEEHSYAILAVIALLARRSGAAPAAPLLLGAALSMLSGVLQTFLLHRGYYAVYWRTDAGAATLLLSSAFYLILHSDGFPLRRLPPMTPLALLCLGLILNAYRVPDAIKYTSGSLCLALAVCTIDIAPRSCLRILRHPVAVTLGLWSFSLYLWQQPFRVVRGEHSALLLLTGAVACGLASFYLLEQPARRFLNRYWGSGHLAQEVAARLRILFGRLRNPAPFGAASAARARQAPNKMPLPDSDRRQKRTGT
jgi:peptidoglycan/LPS O-acetylase OafA/YrhL